VLELVFTRFFKDLSKSDVGIAGGKGASLGELTNAGVPVPNGFVVLSDAFEKFIVETDLDVELDSILDRVNHKEMQSVENASEEIKALILNAEMPREIESEIKKNFKLLGAKFVAVRSSATSEDSSSAAWAGQLDSFLNTTEENVVDGVKHCWASLFTPRAIFYRFEKGLHDTKISVAVVIQKMVQSEISGIAFSVHPVTQDRNQLIIEAGYGLGEAIVSGQITPDSYVVEKSPRRLIDKNVAEQERGLFKIGEKGGNEWQNIESSKGALQKLSDEQILKLSEIILRIETHYGFPCDIEWAFEAKKFFIVQSRPITTLTDTTNDAKMPVVEEKKKVKKKVDEKEEVISWAQNYLQTVPLDIKTARCSLFIADVMFDSYAKPNCFGESYAPFFVPYSNQKLSQIISIERMNGLERNIWKNVLNNPKKLNKVISEANVIQKRIEKMGLLEEDLAKLSSKELAQYYTKLVSVIRKWWAYGSIGEEKGLIVDEVIAPLLKKKHGVSDEFAREYIIDMTMPKTMSIFSEERVAFLDMCIEIAKDKKLFESIKEGKLVDKKYPKLVKKIKEYTKKFYYARTDFYEEIHLDEKSILAVFVKDIENSNLKNLIEEREHILQGIPDLLKRQKEYSKKIKLNKEEKALIDYFTSMHIWMDDRKASMMKQTHYLLSILTELSNRTKLPLETLTVMLVDEVLSVIKSEKIDLVEINKRKESAFAIFGKTNKTIIFSGEETKILTNSIPSEKNISNVLSGTIASKGKQKESKIIGTARLVLSPSTEKFDFGEVLVTSMTRPEFVPIMKKALAIVTDEGGLTSHAAIVSRELGVPCIIGTKNATSLIKSGDLVELDLVSGAVRIVEENKVSGGRARGKDAQVVENIRGMKWEKWLQRPFQAFTLSLFEDSYRRESFEEIGFSGLNSRPMLFQKNFWYYNNLEMGAMDKEVEEYLKTHSMSDITSSLERFFKESRGIISKLIKSTSPLEERFAEIYRILKNACAYIWLAHGTESYYNRKLKEEVPKYVKSNVDKFIGDASFPKKKNANSILDELMRSGLSDQEVAKRAGWVKVRDGFNDPFTAEEIAKMRESLTNAPKFIPVNIPKELKELFEQVSELVFFRTERTDVFYQLYFQARPIINELAKKHKIPFKEMRYYRAKSFILGKAERFDAMLTMAFDGQNTVFQNEPILEETDLESKEIKGTIAFKGKVRGIVKIVTHVSQLNKVAPGDILVTQMTVPSFIPAMVRANAFVTDEGGITCHAAIVAREMQKPCIIGTKNATKILHDEDYVEVDAEKGLVKIINRSN
jgi:phosphoenolpyruvate synthase/pyruvate phosphate dikinase